MEMIIERKLEDGAVRIQLTDAEIDQAYRMKRNEYNKCDLLCRLNQMLDLEEYDDELMVDPEKEYEIGKRTVTGKQLKELVDKDGWLDDLNMEFCNALDNNDSYWESFWLTAEDVIENEIDKGIPKSEKELKQDANRKKYNALIEEIWRSPLDQKAKAEIIDRLINEGV